MTTTVTVGKSDKQSSLDCELERSLAGDSGRVGANQGQEWVPGSFTKLMVAVVAAEMLHIGG